MVKKVVAALTILLVLAGLVWFVSHQPASSSLPISSPSPSPTITATKTSQCQSLNGLPDAVCTPGAVAETDTSVVCNRSTASIRPPVSFTDQLKITQIQQYGYSDTNPKDYEEDHLISLELGGSPTDPKNLWPEPRNTITALGSSAEDKDKVENLCHKKVCDGQITLDLAQKQIASNWKTACQ